MTSHLFRSVAALGAMALLAAWGDPPSHRPEDPSVIRPVVIRKTMTVPPGADSSVPAELGGNGFETIAARDGWQNGSISPEDYRYLRDTNARKGGELRWAEADYPATFIPYGMDAGTTTIATISGLVYESLLAINPLNLDFLPVLASHWKVDPDGQTFHFRIDPNARFSDGHPVTSQDVVSTCRLLADPEILDFIHTAMMETYDPPVAVSRYIVTVRSREKKWKAMFHFGGLPILPAHVIDKWSGRDFIRNYRYEMPPGSGPYVILPSYVKKQKSVTLTRIADWWQGGYLINKGAYNFDRLTMYAVEDENLRYEKYRKGELDFHSERRSVSWATRFDYDNITTGREQKRRIHTLNPQGIQGFAFNMRRPPFNDIRVREAFICLFNREELIEKVMLNAYPISDSYFPNSPYENRNNPKYRYNPERAEQLLNLAGYTMRNAEGIRVKEGRPLEIGLPITSGSELILAPVQQSLKQAGIKLNIRIVNWPQQIQCFDERNFDLAYIASSGTTYPNPRNHYAGELADVPNTNNITGIKNAKLDELIAREETTFDQGKRVTILQQIDSILMATRAYALAWNVPFQRIAYWNHLRQPEFYLARTGDWRSALTLWWSDPDNPVTDPGATDVTFWREWPRPTDPTTDRPR